MASPFPLTIIILTHRQDDQFLRAVFSSQWADQIVVIENNVAADWKKLSTQYCFDVHTWKKPITDFSDLRNWSLQFAKHDWVLFLDSDEWILDDLQLEIRSVIDKPKHSGYYLKRHDMFHNHLLQYGEVGNVRILRLFDKTKGEWRGAIHEEWQTTGSTGELDAPLLHEAHESITKFLEKINFYTNLNTIDESLSLQGLIVKSLVYPIGKFLKNYVLLQGFRDGWAGFVYAYMMSLHSMMVRIKQYEKNVS